VPSLQVKNVSHLSSGTYQHSIESLSVQYIDIMSDFCCCCKVSDTCLGLCIRFLYNFVEYFVYSYCWLITHTVYCVVTRIFMPYNLPFGCWTAMYFYKTYQNQFIMLLIILLLYLSYTAWKTWDHFMVCKAWTISIFVMFGFSKTYSCIDEGEIMASFLLHISNICINHIFTLLSSGYYL
jgi:hypothetical protein